MKIVFLTSILASAMSASAAPFSFAGLKDEPGTPTTLSYPDCGDSEKKAFTCFISEIDMATGAAFDSCLDTCLTPTDSEDEDPTCEDGCALFSDCVDQCGGSECKSEVIDVVNCHLAGSNTDCTCDPVAFDVSSIQSFALNLAATLTLKETKNNLRA
mmetsp:Transcript_26766/g.48546  ORF Transcript_26766/g.48546 Transcript_26766/m.48546 type:complete len:157 (-) Transcript_26766:183-653(-)